MGNGVEFRIMPNGEDGHWYWEVIKNGREVVARGVNMRAPLRQHMVFPTSMPEFPRSRPAPGVPVIHINTAFQFELCEGIDRIPTLATTHRARRYRGRLSKPPLQRRIDPLVSCRYRSHATVPSRSRARPNNVQTW